ncbi:MAG: DUF2330 domain-containing protein, partial [Polyangiaceae bacterium]
GRITVRLPSTFLRSLLVLTAVGGHAAWSHAASACGGCFSITTRPTVVDAHRMAFAITQAQTVLWDQIHYSGDPSEFAWVLPVKPGARIELSRDEFFAALDASTQPLVNYTATGPGCVLAGCSSAGSNGAGGSGTVQVLSQQVVGPYETVTLRSTDPGALASWLAMHQFALTPAIEPMIAQYISEGFDFIALRLRPQCGEQSMQPVRVVTPGADPSLPLRMVAAGVGAQVGIVLYVLGEGRWRPQNFDEVLFDDSKLTWDLANNISNYETLAQSLMAQNGGRSFLTEGADQADLHGWVPMHPDLSGRADSSYYSPSANPGLASAYFAFCRGSSTVPGTSSPVSIPAPCAADAGEDAEAGGDGANAPDVDAGPAVDAGDGGASPEAAADASQDGGAEAAEGGAQPDAGEDGGAAEGGDAGEDADVAEAGTEGGSDSQAADGMSFSTVTDASDASDEADAPVNHMQPDPCQGFDDLDVAFGSASTSTLWVTRLRANLPASALAADLVLEAEPTQDSVTNVHVVPPQPAVSSRQGCVSVTHPKDDLSTVALVAATMLGMAAIRRRRR